MMEEEREFMRHFLNAIMKSRRENGFWAESPKVTDATLVGRCSTISNSIMQKIVGPVFTISVVSYDDNPVVEYSLRIEW